MPPITHVSQATFAREVRQSQLPVLVDFYADWCGPCRMLAPILERLQAEFAGSVKIVKVNVDHEPQLAAQFQVESIPTLAFVRDGHVVHRAAGLPNEAGLRQALRQLAGDGEAARRPG